MQASIPDANGVIHGCYNTSLAHGNPTGALRVIDTAKPNGNCASWEAPLNWNQTGPTGPKGPTGARGPTGPAGPTFVATGLVFPSGSVSFTSGPVPTVTHPGTGHYTFKLTGMGTGCPLPQLTSYGPTGQSVMSFQGGACSGGTIGPTDVYTGDGADHFWVYMVVGVGGGASPVRGGPLPTTGHP